MVISQEDLEFFKQFQLIYTSNSSYFDDQLPKLKHLRIPIAYDFSGCWTDEARVEKVAPQIQIAFLSCGGHPEEDIRGVCRKMHSLGVQLIAATQGAKGVMVYDGNDYYFQPPQYVAAVDTLGAGDSFATAFLISLLKDGNPLVKGSMWKERLLNSMRSGASFAANTCMVNGAFGHGISCVI